MCHKVCDIIHSHYCLQSLQNKSSGFTFEPKKPIIKAIVKISGLMINLKIIYQIGGRRSRSRHYLLYESELLLM